MELVRILRPDGTLEKGAQVPSLNSKQIINMYRLMLLNRRIDERLTTLQRQGRIGFCVSSVGEEASIIGSALALDEKDWIIPCYRELGAALARGFSLFEFFCQMFGNSEDKIKGRQMPNHYASAKLRFGSISSPVGNQIPHATGISLASKLRGTGEAALVYFGDGATSEGDFHVAMNFAAVYKTPTIFLCRNNQWAISTPRSFQTLSPSIASKATAYGMDGFQVDGNDIFGVYSVTRDAAVRAHQGDGSTLIEAVTYRLGPHSTSDDPRVYRDEDEVEKWKAEDPISRLKAYLMIQGHWNEKKDRLLEDEVREQIQTALQEAEELGTPPINTVFEDVLDEMPWHLREQLEELRKAQELDPVNQEV